MDMALYNTILRICIKRIKLYKNMTYSLQILLLCIEFLYHFQCLYHEKQSQGILEDIRAVSLCSNYSWTFFLHLFKMKFIIQLAVYNFLLNMYVEI